MRAHAFLITALATAIIPASAMADTPHVVQKGETLTSVAATDGLSLGSLAAANGLSTSSQLVIGQILQIPPQTRSTRSTGTRTLTMSTTTRTGGVAVQATSSAVAVSSSSIAATPTPTREHVTGSEIASIAGANGVPAALAEAIAWQESGWNNAEVSDIGAVGVMQIVPSTWTWINSYLTPSTPLGTDSAAENVRAGVLLLHQLLTLTGNDQSLAIAGYFQGLSSVDKIGMYRSTRRYVANVEAIEQRLAA